MSASSYGSAKAAQTFRTSDTPNGKRLSEDDDAEHTLELRFTIHSFTEQYPYGEGYTEELISEIIDDSYEYELGGVEVERDELDERFGSKWVSELVDHLKDNATVICTEPYND